MTQVNARVQGFLCTIGVIEPFSPIVRQTQYLNGEDNEIIVPLVSLPFGYSYDVNLFRSELRPYRLALKVAADIGQPIWP